MTLPLVAMIREENQELVAQKVKEQKGGILPHLRDRVSHLFVPEIFVVIVPPHVQTPLIDYYRGEDNPVEHIQRHEVYLLGQANDDNHFYSLLLDHSRRRCLSLVLRATQFLMLVWGRPEGQVYRLLHGRKTTPVEFGYIGPH